MKTVPTCLIYLLIVLVPASEAHTIKPATVLFGSNFARLTNAQQNTLANEFNMVLTAQWKYDSALANEAANILKSKNTDIILLAHMDSRELRRKQILYVECNKNEGLFDHTVETYTAENRILSIDKESFLMNVSNPDWSDKIIVWFKNLSSAYNGIMLDNGTSSLFLRKYNGKPYWFTGEGYRVAMNAHLSRIKSRLPDKTIIYNGISDGYLYDHYGDSLDGGVCEGFASGPTHAKVDPMWVERSVNTLLSKSALGNIVIAAPKSNGRFKPGERLFVMACYLISMHPLHTYYILFEKPQGQLTWYPEYHLDLGNPRHQPVKMSDMLDASGLYIREFTRGKVLVNISDSPKSYTLSESYWEITFTGGGLIDKGGRYSGKLLSTYKPKGSVAIPAGSALILSTYNPSK